MVAAVAVAGSARARALARAADLYCTGSRGGGLAPLRRGGLEEAGRRRGARAPGGEPLTAVSAHPHPLRSLTR